MKVELVTNLKRQATKILADLHLTKADTDHEHGQPSHTLLMCKITSLCSADLSCLRALTRRAGCT